MEEMEALSAKKPAVCLDDDHGTDNIAYNSAPLVLLERFTTLEIIYNLDSALRLLQICGVNA